MNPRPLLLTCLCLNICLTASASCPTVSDIESSDFTTTITCEVTNADTYQGLTGTNVTLTISSGDTLTFNGNLHIYDDLDVYGVLIVNGDMEVRSPAGGSANVTVHDGGAAYINGDYTNGDEDVLDVLGVIVVFPGDEGQTTVDGDMTVSGTYTNNDGGTTNVSETGTLNSGSYNDQGGSTNIANGSASDCATGCCGSGCTPLPVELAYFTGSQASSHALLSWATSTEINNDFFILRKKMRTDSTFKVVTKIDGNGNSKERLLYEYIDSNFEDDALYELSQVDYDGTKTLVKTILVKKETAVLHNLVLYPNPSDGDISLKSNNLITVSHYILSDISGKTLASGNNQTIQDIEIAINASTKDMSGHFLLSLKINDQEIITKHIHKLP